MFDLGMSNDRLNKIVSNEMANGLEYTFFTKYKSITSKYVIKCNEEKLNDFFNYIEVDSAMVDENAVINCINEMYNKITDAGGKYRFNNAEYYILYNSVIKCEDSIIELAMQKNEEYDDGVVSDDTIRDYWISSATVDDAMYVVNFYRKMVDGVIEDVVKDVKKDRNIRNKVSHIINYNFDMLSTGVMQTLYFPYMACLIEDAEEDNTEMLGYDYIFPKDKTFMDYDIVQLR